ncbi:hypothetical protein F2Q70_00031240 [Brassica cretica]|uniref:COP1-interacting protein 7 n=1 Tax=Brassica cretica TaxID=69181 RepID=A0A8S9FGS7_BRACR|nr:hypothetical protein F2Q70_00031240 [Brassica cretica]
MKSSTRLDSVVFQLTPTRTRCDLLVTANGKTEKIATGLLDPFLAHLKTAQDQVSKGGYSIILKPPEDSDIAVWFTKATIERFVRFVSNPDVLERLYTLETEIKQIREAIGIQNNSEIALPVAFQTFLLQDADREERTADHMMEKEVAGKKRQGAGGNDPLAYGEREAEKYQERDTADIQNGTAARKFRGSSDSFMVRQRENGFENSSDPLNLNGLDHPRNGLDKRSSFNMDDDSYIVTREAGSNTRNAIDIGSEISSYHQTDENERKQISYEPHDLSLMPERETEKLSAGYDPALDFGSRALKKNNQAAGAAKKSVRDPKSRLSNDAADKRKASGPIRKGRPTKMSPLDEARARADKLRNFKADLLIMKKEKEEEERKRIEALKIARQKRIASKTNSAGGQSQLPARKKLVNKFSPGAPRASKFSDSEPGSLSPLQRLPIRSASLGSNESQKLPKSGNKLSTGSKSTVNRLTRSISPLPPSKRETIATVNRVTRSASPLPLSKREARVSLDSQNKSVSRIRRLSEPKIGNNSAPSSSVRSLRTTASKKATDTPEIKKISAIVNYDIAKIASLPELKIKTPKGPTNVAVKGVEKSKSSASEIEPSGSKNKSLGQNDVNETPVIEKTVVMVLPNSARSISADQTKRDKSEVVPETTPESGNDLVLVRLETLSDLVTETPKFLTSQSVAVKPYEAPHARVSSLEDSCTVYSEYSRAPAPSVHSNEAALETGKVLVPEKKISEALEKSQTKESASKGLRKLLKFGKKSQSSSSTSEYHTESDNAAGNSNEDHGSAITAATTSEDRSSDTAASILGVDILLIDWKSTLIQERSFYLLNTFKEILQERSFYELSIFYVTRSNTNFWYVAPLLQLVLQTKPCSLRLLRWWNGTQERAGDECIERSRENIDSLDSEPNEIYRFELLMNEMIELEKRVQRSTNEPINEEGSSGDPSISSSNTRCGVGSELKERKRRVARFQLFGSDSVAAMELLRRSVIGDELTENEKKSSAQDYDWLSISCSHWCSYDSSLE